MLLDHVGEPEAAAGVVHAIEQVLSDQQLRTRDLGGRASTVTCGRAVADAVRRAAERAS